MFKDILFRFQIPFNIRKHSSGWHSSKDKQSQYMFTVVKNRHTVIKRKNKLVVKLNQWMFYKINLQSTIDLALFKYY